MDKQALFDAIRNHDLTTVKQLLMAGKSMNFHKDKEPFFTPLIDAIDELDDEGSVEIVLALIEAGADVNCWDKNKDTHPLILALKIDCIEVVNSLLDAGCNPDILDPEGMTPLRWAVEHNYLELVARLLKIGVPITLCKSDPFTGRMPLSIAVESLNWDMTTLLLEAGADPYLIDVDYRKTLDYLPKNLSEDERLQWENLLFKR